MPTGIGRNKELRAVPGVNAFGTKISGLVLKTFTVIDPSPVQPKGVVAFTVYFIILSSTL